MNKRLCLIIAANLGRVMTEEELLAIRKEQSGLLSNDVFDKADVGVFNNAVEKVINRLNTVSPYKLSNLNYALCRELQIDLRIDLISLIDAYPLLLKRLSHKLADRKADWALYKQVCILLSFYVLLSEHLSNEATYDFISLCRRIDLFLR